MSLDPPEPSSARSTTEVHKMMYNIYSSRIPIVSVEDPPDLQRAIGMERSGENGGVTNVSSLKEPATTYGRMGSENQLEVRQQGTYITLDQPYPMQMLPQTQATPGLISMQAVAYNEGQLAGNCGPMALMHVAGYGTERGIVQQYSRFNSGEIYEQAQAGTHLHNNADVVLDMPLDLSMGARCKSPIRSPSEPQGHKISCVSNAHSIDKISRSHLPEGSNEQCKVPLTIKIEDGYNSDSQSRIPINFTPQNIADMRCHKSVGNDIFEDTSPNQSSLETNMTDDISLNQQDMPIRYQDACTSMSDLILQQHELSTNKHESFIKDQHLTTVRANTNKLANPPKEPPLHEDTLLMMVNHLPRINRGKNDIYVAVGDLREVLFPWCQTIKCTIFNELFFEIILQKVGTSVSEQRACVLYCSAKERHDFASQYQIMCLKNILVRLDVVVSSLKAFYSIMWKTHQQVIRDTGKVPCRRRITPLDMLDSKKALAEVEACIRHVNAWRKAQKNQLKAIETNSDEGVSIQDISPTNLHSRADSESLPKQNTDPTKQKTSLISPKKVHVDRTIETDSNQSEEETTMQAINTDKFIDDFVAKGYTENDLECTLQPTTNTKYFIRHFRGELLPICKGNKLRKTGNYVPLVTILTLFPFVKGHLDLSTVALIRKYPMLRMRKASGMEANMLTRLRSACRHIGKEDDSWTFLTSRSLLLEWGMFLRVFLRAQNVLNRHQQTPTKAIQCLSKCAAERKDAGEVSSPGSESSSPEKSDKIISTKSSIRRNRIKRYMVRKSKRSRTYSSRTSSDSDKSPPVRPHRKRRTFNGASLPSWRQLSLKMKQTEGAKVRNTSDSDTEPYSILEVKKTYSKENLGTKDNRKLCTTEISAATLSTLVEKRIELTSPPKIITSPNPKKTLSHSCDPFVGFITGSWFNQRPPKKYCSTDGKSDQTTGCVAQGLSLLQMQFAGNCSNKKRELQTKTSVATSIMNHQEKAGNDHNKNDKINLIKSVGSENKNAKFIPSHPASDQYDILRNESTLEEKVNLGKNQTVTDFGEDATSTSTESSNSVSTSKLQSDIQPDFSVKDDSQQTNERTRKENTDCNIYRSSDGPPVLQRFDVIHRSLSNPDNKRNSFHDVETGQMPKPPIEKNMYSNSEEAYVYIDVDGPGLYTAVRTSCSDGECGFQDCEKCSSTPALDLPTPDCVIVNEESNASYDALPENTEMDWTTWIAMLKKSQRETESPGVNKCDQFQNKAVQDVPIGEAECVIEDTGKSDCSEGSNLLVIGESQSSNLVRTSDDTEQSEIGSSGTSTVSEDDGSDSRRHKANTPWEPGRKKKVAPTAVVAPRPKPSGVFDLVHAKKTILHRFLGQSEPVDGDEECAFQLPYNRDLLVRKYIRTGRIRSGDKAPRKLLADEKTIPSILLDTQDQSSLNAAFREEQERMWQILQEKQLADKQKDDVEEKTQISSCGHKVTFKTQPKYNNCRESYNGFVFGFGDATIPYVLRNGYKYIAAADARMLLSGCDPHCHGLKYVLAHMSFLQPTMSTFDEVSLMQKVQGSGCPLRSGDVLVRLDLLADVFSRVQEDLAEYHRTHKNRHAKGCGPLQLCT